MRIKSHPFGEKFNCSAAACIECNYLKVKEFWHFSTAVFRINEVMTSNASDREIVERADSSERVILTQDLDFSEIIALSGKMKPSLISLRLSSSRIEFVNAILEKVLPRIEKDVEKGAIISVEDDEIRILQLPL